MSKKQLATLLFMVLISAVLLGILPAIAQSTERPVNLGNLRIINALVGLGPVDVYVDGERIAFGVEPRQATPYFAIPAGKHIVAVRPNDALPFTAPIADVLLDLSPNQSQSAIVYQKQFATPADPENNIPAFEPPYEQSGAIFVKEDDRSPIQLGKTRLTAVHLAVGTPQRLSITFPSREALLYQVGLEQPYGTVDVAAGLYRLAIVDADSPSLDVVTREGEQNFYANTLQTLVIVPDVQPVAGPVPYQVGPLSTQPTMFVVSAPVDPPAEGVRLRIIHAASNAEALDVYVDERLVARRMSFGRTTEYLGIDDYSHTISLRREGAGSTAPPLARANFNITADNRQQSHWTLLLLNASDKSGAALPVIQPGNDTPGNTIINTQGDSMFMALLPDDVSQTQQGLARVRLINSVPGVPPLRLLTPALPRPVAGPGTPTAVEPTATPVGVPLPPPIQLTEPVVFAAEANESEVPAGLYTTLSVAPDISTNPLFSLSNVQLVRGMVYTLVVIGSPVGDPPISVIQLADYGAGVPLERLYRGQITAASVNVRFGPAATSGIVARLPLNTQTEVLGRNPNGEWIRIRFTNPETNTVQQGWISATANIIRVTRLGVPVDVLTLPLYIAPE